MVEKIYRFNRRQFLKWVSVLGIGGFIAACRAQTLSVTPTVLNLLNVTETKTPKPEPTVSPSFQDTISETQAIIADPTATSYPTVSHSPSPETADLAVVHGVDIEKVVMKAVLAIGGIEQFITPGANVIIKPNICTNYYSYEYAATTNPDVVAALVRLSLSAGAGRVRVMDQPFGGTAESAYTRSGIAEAVRNAGGEMEIMSENKYIVVDIPQGVDIRQWTFYKPILDADVLINVPIAKHHGLTRLTLGGKNLLGTIGNRAGIHQNYGQRIADLVSRVRPTLTVIDAIRILMENGPTGGNLNDVKKADTIIASRDIVAADSYAATLFGLEGPDIAYIQAASNMGLGSIDLKGIKIEEISV